MEERIDFDHFIETAESISMNSMGGDLPEEVSRLAKLVADLWRVMQKVEPERPAAYKPIRD